MVAEDWHMRNQRNLLQRGTPQHFKHPAGFLVPMVNLNRCEGKGLCVNVCPEKAITLARANTRNTGTIRAEV